MKVAVSIPDDVFEEAERVAALSGKTRSGLYAEALEAFLAASRDQRVTEQLNAVYAVHDSKLDPALRRAQAKAIGREAW
jgi:metal-responsive CopG/Arc/MetJ family transcriptional regulator